MTNVVITSLQSRKGSWESETWLVVFLIKKIESLQVTLLISLQRALDLQVLPGTITNRFKSNGRFYKFTEEIKRSKFTKTFRF